MSDKQELSNQLHKRTLRQGDGFADHLEIDEGVIRGRAVPIGKWVEIIPGLAECYEPGVFSRQFKDPARVKILLEHKYLVGVATGLREESDGVYFDAKISGRPQIPKAQEARALLAEGLLDEVSVGFRSLRDGTVESHKDDGTTLWRHRRGQLLEISLVPFGALGREATITRAAFLEGFDPLSDKRQADLEAKRQQARQWFDQQRKLFSVSRPWGSPHSIGVPAPWQRCLRLSHRCQGVCYA